jgi:hypothetical protein
VKRLDRPLFPDVSGQVGGVCLLGLRAGNAERGDRRDRLAAQVGEYRSMRNTWLTCWNGSSSGAGSTWMVRVVIRPWPLSVAVWAIGA